MSLQGSRFRWRDYSTRSGARLVKDFLDSVTDEEAAAVVAAMKEVATAGRERARHLRGDIYEVRAESHQRSFRILFAKKTRFILLSLDGFAKKTQRTAAGQLEVGERRLKEWRARGRREA